MVPVLPTRADRARGPRSLAEASICVPLGEMDLVVVNRRTSGAGTRPKRSTACREAVVDRNALRSAGLVVDDEPWYLMVCVPAGTVPCTLMVAGFHPHTHGTGASDPLHRLFPHGRAVRRRVPRQVTGRLLDPVGRTT